MATDTPSSVFTGVQRFYSDIWTACREASAVTQVLHMLVDTIDAGGELMTMEQLRAAADHGRDLFVSLYVVLCDPLTQRPQAAGLAAGTGAALIIRATGVFKNGPIWKPASIVLPAWFAGFALTRLYSNFNFVRIAMRDDDSKLSRKLRAAYKKLAPPGSTTLDNL